MCVIVASESIKKRPSLNDLKSCEARNPHGIGFAWSENNKVKYKKGITVEEVHGLFSEIKGPAVAHFRWATVGGISEKLCHPFPVVKKPSVRTEGAAKRVLFHNGTWSGWRSECASLGKAYGLPSGSMSDSRAAAWSIAHRGEGFLRYMGGRFCVLKPDGFRLYNEGWTTIEGVVFSNLRWRPERARQVTTFPSRKWKPTDSDWFEHLYEKERGAA